jgi:nucleoside-diphosphate-sugar epimerase
VIHLAARLEGSQDTESLEHVNVEGTGVMAQAARAAGVGRFVHLGSAGVYGSGDTPRPRRETDPPAPATSYEHSKLKAEGRLRAELDGSDTRWVILRSAGVFGPGRPATAQLFRRALARRVWLHGPGLVLIHPTYVEDVVSGLWLALGVEGAAGQVFNLGGERPLAYPEFLALIARRAGRGCLQVRAPRALGIAAGGLCRTWSLAGRVPPARLQSLARKVTNRGVDITKARTVLGFEPVPLVEGVDRTLASLEHKGTA